jgi:hypothetical protein
MTTFFATIYAAFGVRRSVLRDRPDSAVGLGALARWDYSKKVKQFLAQ